MTIDIPSAEDLLAEYERGKMDWLPELEKYVASAIRKNARALARGERVQIARATFRHTDWRSEIWDVHVLALKAQLTEKGYTVWDWHNGGFEVGIILIQAGAG